MIKSEAAKWVMSIVNAVCAILIALVLSIQLPTFCVPFYEYEYARNGTYSRVKMDESGLMTVTRHMLSYMRGEAAELNILTTVDARERMFFSDIEIYHMKDVKDLFMLAFSVRNISFAVFVIMFFLLYACVPDWKKYLFRSYEIVSAAVFAVLLSLALLISVNFNRAFEIFHEIFFTNDLWQLDERVDLLVNIVPTEFFIDIAMFVGVLFSVFLVSLFLIGKIGKGRALRG